MQLPPPTAALTHALRHADFADAASMDQLQRQVALYASVLRSMAVPASVVAGMIRGVVDDSLATREVPVRTSENRTRLLRLAEEWSAPPNG
ncbi:MAG TPA: hypothetical protein VJ672_13545 [Gemmatimonadaceae bacterium]|nr:hypothetical protein [Gemmatimonadaceae bacterium]